MVTSKFYSDVINEEYAHISNINCKMIDFPACRWRLPDRQCSAFVLRSNQVISGSYRKRIKHY